MAHFCTCRDLACPLNPNNPKNADKNIGCDLCIQKNLKQGEVPSCVFNNVHSIDDWDDFSMAGFCRFCAHHGLEGVADGA
jgi:hypothetical protein